jgi:hypothetical protein
MATAKKQQQQEENKKFVFTSKNMHEITEQMSDGVIVKRYMNPWFKGEVGVRRILVFHLVFTQRNFKNILDVWTMCIILQKNIVKLKEKMVTIGPIKLRDYKKEY